MTSDANIVIGIKSNLSGGKVIKRNLDEIKRSAGGVENATSRIDKQFARLNDSATRLGRALGALIGTYFGVQGVRALLRVSDTYTVIENKLKLVTDGTQDLANVQAELIAISDRTFTSLSSNATLFNRLTIATREFGATQQDVLRGTEALQQTFRISGATAAEAANSTVQFAQGLAAGALRGDEFRSVAENNIRLQTLLAEGLGVTTGELKQMADQGQLTAEVIFPVLTDSLEKLNQEAENIAPTFAQAFDKVKEKIGQGIDETIRAESEFNNLGQAIADLSPVAKGFGVVIGGVVVQLTEMVNKLNEILRLLNVLPAPLNEFLDEPFSRVPSDFGLGPQFSEISQNDLNVSLGGTPNVPKPGSKPDIPDKFFLKQNEAKSKELERAARASKKAADAIVAANKRAQKAIDDVTDSIEFETIQLTRSKVEQQVYNNLRAAGTTINTEAGQQIARLTREYEENSQRLEQQNRLTEELAGTFDGFFRNAIQGAEGFGGALKGLLGSVADLIFELTVLEPIKQNLLGGSSGGGIFSSLLGGVSNIFGGGGVTASSFLATQQSNIGSGLFGPGFNTTGSFDVGGVGGIDQNQLSLNGTPIARVSKGETVSVGGGSGSGSIQIFQEFNFALGVQETVQTEIMQWAPTIKEETIQAIEQKQARGG